MGTWFYTVSHSVGIWVYTASHSMGIWGCKAPHSVGFWGYTASHLMGTWGVWPLIQFVPETTQPPIQWALRLHSLPFNGYLRCTASHSVSTWGYTASKSKAPWGLFLFVKALRCEADHSASSSKSTTEPCNIQTPIRNQYMQPHHHRINHTPMYFNGLF